MLVNVHLKKEDRVTVNQLLGRPEPSLADKVIAVFEAQGKDASELRALSPAQRVERLLAGEGWPET